MLDCLAIAPHPDDAELGAAGLLLSLKHQGLKVGILDLTDGEPTPWGTVDLRRAETQRASEILQLDWRDNLGLTNRSLEADLPSRKKLATAIRRLKPRWLLAPYWVDAHPDHVAATPLIEAARFWAKLTKTDMPGDPHFPRRIFYYFCAHLRQHVPPAFVLDITEHWERKFAAIGCYQSQFVTGRPDTTPTFLESLRDEAAYWGRQIGVGYGEPFASRETIGLSGLSELR